MKNFPDILSLFMNSMGDVTVIPIFTNFEKPATRFLINGVRDSKKPLKLQRGLILNTKIFSLSSDNEIDTEKFSEYLLGPRKEKNRFEYEIKLILSKNK